ncbi:MAG TPA: MFS transporter [Spirochaetia bacterium]|nr:MFS transporter [Spirochaetia bacterium]
MTAPSAPAPGNGLDSVARRHFLRNALLIGLENAGFVVAIAFVGTNTVLPTFIVRLGGSTFLVGLAATCQTAGWLLPQLFGAGLLAGKSRIMPYLLRPLYIGRPLILAVAGATVLLGARSPGVLMGILFAAILGFFVTDGISSVAWFELIAKAVPPDRRGRLYGSAQIAGGVGGMAVGALVAVVLKSPGLPFPRNYALLFGLSGTLFLLNVLPFLFVREPVHERPAEEPTAPLRVRGFLLSLVRILKEDRTFVRLTGSRLLFGLATSAFPFYILFMDRELSLSPDQLGLFVSSQVFGGLLGGLAIGWIADHAGPRTVIRLSGVVCGIVPCLALAMSLLPHALGPALVPLGTLLFVLVGVVGSASFIGFMNYLMEVSPLEQRTSYVGLFNSLAGALMVAPPVLGWLVQAVSFRALFLVTIVASLGSLLVSLGLRRPPRRQGNAP